VYADIDVECLKPIDTWNMQHGNDAAVLLGMENFDAKRKPHKVHVTNWAIAAMPGHPLLGLMPSVVTKAIQQQYFALARAQTKALSPQLYENGILDRTGPAALTTAMYDYFDSIKFDLNNVTQADINGEKGVLAGGVRVLPVVALSSGWEVAAARSKAQALTCADVAKNKPQALVCHMFFGSWPTSWGLYTPKRTYDTC
jgi:mannosyltransferase OCH1-like enzyme